MSGEARVVAYSGCCYANEPREFYTDDGHHFVRRVGRTWVEQTRGLEGLTRQVWEVADQDGRRFSLTYYWTGDFWEVTAL